MIGKPGIVVWSGRRLPPPMIGGRPKAATPNHLYMTPKSVPKTDPRTAPRDVTWVVLCVSPGGSLGGGPWGVPEEVSLGVLRGVPPGFPRRGHPGGTPPGVSAFLYKSAKYEVGRLVGGRRHWIAPPRRRSPRVSVKELCLGEGAGLASTSPHLYPISIYTPLPTEPPLPTPC